MTPSGMNQVHAKMRVFVERLIAYETKAGHSSRTKIPAGFPVIEKLRPPLSMLMGDRGFSALLSRALVLAGAKVPWLLAVQVKPDGSLEGVEGHEVQTAPGEVAEGRIVLAANLLGLLVTFIGESLTLQLVREVWPKVSVHDLDFDEGEKK